MHSQNDEECHILDAFREGPAGNFLDVGAYDVTTLSNTHCLAVKGWNGVCVEPSAFVFPKLVGLYQGWPDIQVVNGALDFSHLLANLTTATGRL